MDFIVAAANLYGQIYGITGSKNRADIQSILQGVKVPEFTPKSSVKIAVTDQQLKEENEERKEEGEILGLIWNYTINLNRFKKNIKISLLISLSASLRQSQTGDVKGEAVQTPAEGPKLPDASTGVWEGTVFVKSRSISIAFSQYILDASHFAYLFYNNFSMNSASSVFTENST